MAAAAIHVVCVLNAEYFSSQRECGKAESASTSDSEGVSRAVGLAWVNQSQLPAKHDLNWEKIEMRYEAAASICRTAAESQARDLWIYFINEFAQLFKIYICLKCG